MSDKLSDGRAIRILTVIDQFTRECVWLEVVAALRRATAEHGGSPRNITLDNGSEFAGRAMEMWAIETGVQLCFIRPGRPVENGFIESFNGRLRNECLNVESFMTLEEAQAKLAEWRNHYNHIRPHSALDDRPPAVLPRCTEHRHRASLCCHRMRQTAHRVKRSLCRLTPPLTRLAVCLKISIIRAKRSYASPKTRGSLLSLWSDFQAHKTGSGEP